MLAATLTTVVVFFPVTFLYGVSRFLFTALALTVVLAPDCLLLRRPDRGPSAHVHFKGPRFPRTRDNVRGQACSTRSTTGSNGQFHHLLERYQASLDGHSGVPEPPVGGHGVLWRVWRSIRGSDVVFSQDGSRQFVLNLKAPTGTRIERTEAPVERVEKLIREEVPPIGWM